VFDTVLLPRVDSAAQNDRIEERLGRIEECLDRTATVVVLQLNGKATEANWWPRATNELLAAPFEIAIGALLFCALFTTRRIRRIPTTIIIGTVVATLLVAAAAMWGVSWWRARRLGYSTLFRQREESLAQSAGLAVTLHKPRGFGHSYSSALRPLTYSTLDYPGKLGFEAINGAADRPHRHAPTEPRRAQRFAAGDVTQNPASFARRAERLRRKARMENEN
jgi:hypothetical protein